MIVSIDFYYGLGSRYSYLAASQILRIEAKFNCQFVWQPIFSGKLMQLWQRNPFSDRPVSGQYDWAYRQLDAQRWADYYGIPFHEPKLKLTTPEMLAIAVLAAKQHDLLIVYSQLLFQKIFVEQVEIEVEILIELATSLGIPEEGFRRNLRSPDLHLELDQFTQEAFKRGAFGVPTFFIDSEMFWGNDRLPLLEYYLARNS
jgi:2-hydroxychromene-2-carboxylate isomerase